MASFIEKKDRILEARSYLETHKSICEVAADMLGLGKWGDMVLVKLLC